VRRHATICDLRNNTFVFDRALEDTEKWLAKWEAGNDARTKAAYKRLLKSGAPRQRPRKTRQPPSAPAQWASAPSPRDELDEPPAGKEARKRNTLETGTIPSSRVDLVKEQRAAPRASMQRVTFGRPE
jgi:hypothetical protein